MKILARLFYNKYMSQSSDFIFNKLLINYFKDFINLKIFKNYEEIAIALKMSRQSIDNWLTFKHRISETRYILYLERLLDYLSSKTKEYQLLNDGITEMKIKLTIEKKKFSQSPP